MVVMIAAAVILVGCGILMLAKGEKLLSEGGEKNRKKAKRNALVIGSVMIIEAAAVSLKMYADYSGSKTLSYAVIIAGIAVLAAAFVITVLRNKKDNGEDAGENNNPERK